MKQRGGFFSIRASRELSALRADKKSTKIEIKDSNKVDTIETKEIPITLQFVAHYRTHYKPYT